MSHNINSHNLIISTKSKKMKKNKDITKHEINQIKIEIKDLKNTINELVKMMNAVYEFEDV